MRFSNTIFTMVLIFAASLAHAAPASATLPSGKTAPEKDLGECGAKPEPLKLQNFSITMKNDRLLLNWLTEFENSTNYFELQRSEDGIVFDSVDLVHAKGSSDEPVSYKYYLYGLQSDVEYYRLKMVLHNDASQYSQILKVEKGKKKKRSIRVHPVPFKDKFNISYKSEEEQNIEIRLYNEAGQLVFVRHELADEGRNRFSSPELSSLEEGKYNLVLETNNSNAYQKIRKVKK
ncbi:MAG: T9SS type A sorting domain-containing protein [Bacteroidia bacterium]